jgi:hypothetical protein
MHRVWPQMSRQDLAKGERPTDEEVTWVLKTADASNKIIDGQIDRREVVRHNLPLVAMAHVWLECCSTAGLTLFSRVEAANRFGRVA